MQQVLFWIPIKFSSFPDGIPVYAYGGMLFLTFVLTVWFATVWSRRAGLNVPREKFQDLAIALFVLGLAGARLTYMLQFGVPLSKFLRIWEGGIVLYGGIVGGAIAFVLFHHYVLRPFKVTLWQMSDLAAPCVCIGIAVGRIGCLLNGCCWGQLAGPGCPAIEFPLLTSPAREMLVDKDGVQTITGFLTQRDPNNPDDVRTVIGKLERDSAAAKAGVLEGDKILKLRFTGNWQINGEVLILSFPAEQMLRNSDALKEFGRVQEVDPIRAGESTIKLFVEKPEQYRAAYDAARGLSTSNVLRSDLFIDLLHSWPRGRNSVQFVVERGGQEIELPMFTPRSLGLHPTQIYETISMILLMLLVIAYYPFRRHDGQVWVLFMLAYAVHRFLNEILRTEPVEGLQMTLSQNISVIIVVVAIALEIYLRKTQPRRS